MPLITYTPYRPGKEATELIDICNKILVDYETQGYQLTLRQLYYQLVARDHIPNNVKSYNRIGDIVSRAREGGLIDWEHIVDRTRNVRSLPHWDDAKHFMQSVAPQFNLDLWEGQDRRPMVFVEKEALEQVVGMAARRYDVPYFANKGYLSASSVWSIAHDTMLYHESCRDFVVFHLGDHDPSGIDMTRDIQERLTQFSRPMKAWQKPPRIEVVRLALNMEQIAEHDPPPNPAKDTDSRFAAYQEEYGDESWELDALEPSLIDALVSEAIKNVISDEEEFGSRMDQQRAIREKLAKVKVK